MKHGTLTILAALFVGLSVGGTAYAADQTAKQKKDETQVVPSKQSLDPLPATVDKMDANAQREHDRDSGVAGASADSSTSGSGKMAPNVRDWSKIDANHDNLIEPEEMEGWLKQTGPQAAKQKQ